MTSFKFPPPPPPPPKASTNNNQPSYSGQRGGPSRGRGGDRGRGSDRGRGRGGHGRGGFEFGQGRGNAHGGRGGSRGGSHSNYGGPNQRQHQPSQLQSASSPVYQPQHGGQAQPQLNPQAFAQAMTFMSTPAGMQSMAAFAQHMSSTANSAPQRPQSPPPTQSQAPRYSPGQQAGQKRKRPEHNTSVPPLPQKKPHSGPKPPRAKAAAPPPVPSFGFSLPSPSAPTSQPNNKRYQKKRINLGLSEQNAMDESSSEEEDMDEEAAFADKTKVEGVAFEHNGEMISLQTAADVQAYIKDRRRNYPTQQRIAEKAQEAAAKREHELEFLRRVKGKPRKAATETRPVRPPKPERKVKEVDSKKQEELAALRKRLHESMINKQQQPMNLLGIGYESETDSDAESSILSESSVVSSSDDSSDSEDEDEEESDSDGAPETTSSKAVPPPVTIPPPAPVSAPPSQVCKNWSKTGKCKFGKGCRWAHPPHDMGSGQEKAEKRMGLFEKLVEQELEKADRMALEAIKYLGQNGFLG